MVLSIVFWNLLLYVCCTMVDGKIKCVNLFKYFDDLCQTNKIFQLIKYLQVHFTLHRII